MGYWNSENGVIGDDPVDTMGDAFRKIRKHYKRDLEREPTTEELSDVFNFVIAPLEKQSKEEGTTDSEEK